MVRRRRSLALLAPLLACHGGMAAESGFSNATGLGALTEAASSTGGDGGMSTSGGEVSTTAVGASSGSTGVKLDMAVPDVGTSASVGCQGKIDFVFVISTSGTMAPTQKQLVESFPGFMSIIAEQLSEFDVRVLSAKPNETWTMVDCANCADASCDPSDSPPACGVALEPCDARIGAGVTFPAGGGAANRRCELFGGHRYLVGEDPDFKGSFECIMQSGTNGAYASAGEAMAKAVSPEFTSGGGCNEGFVRDDALLVVTILSDVFDEESQGSVEGWIEALRAAKHGDDHAFAVLVLTTDIDVGFWQLCHPDVYSPTKNRLRLLVEGVEHGFIGSICEESYGPFFADAVAEVVELCDGLVIPQ